MADLSGMWDFRMDPKDVGESQGWQNGLSEARSIAVPGSWNEQFDDAYSYLGTAWYVRQAYAPRAWRDRQVFLRVGSANYASKVWVNGKLAGTHEGGHLPFEFDVSSLLKWDASNTIAISVENLLKPTRVPAGNLPAGGALDMVTGNPRASFDFFPYAGIHRAVVLYAVPKEHIEDVTVRTTLDGVVRVTVRRTSASGSGKVLLAGLTANLEFRNGVAEASVRVPQARLWSRKIVFSTNLPNVGDLDEALVRPGRCFARVFVRKLTDAEAQALAVEIAAGDAEKAGRVSRAFSEKETRGRSLAEVYQALQ